MMRPSLDDFSVSKKKNEIASAHKSKINRLVVYLLLFSKLFFFFQLLTYMMLISNIVFFF
jgi:hypothetical protein